MVSSRNALHCISFDYECKRISFLQGISLTKCISLREADSLAVTGDGGVSPQSYEFDRVKRYEFGSAKRYEFTS